ncbi:hypothetical protein HDU79_000977 [Rhizoclosmatium sp. JEL0117]|nr:hypothetical protein HDU79_000977 [Rhizoclosmatium sp. JEL0117]
MYTATTPALVPTANPAARASLAPLTAPDVVAGTPWNLADFAMASAESEARKRVRDPGQVTQNEVAAAKVRAFAVGLEFVPAAVGVGAAAGAPLNALLTAYDLNVNGTLQIRRARLGIFLGLVSRFA